MRFPLANSPALISIIVPVYNEAQNVSKVFDSLCRAWEGRDDEWEMILVDDNSPDGTSSVARKIAQEDSRLRVIRRIGRRGLTSAVIEGILSSSSHFVAVMDGDGQHDETILPRMLDALVDGTDLVVGTRYAKGGDASGLSGKYREWLSKLGTKVAQKVSGKKCSDPMSGFFAVKRDLIEEILPSMRTKGFKILFEFLAKSSDTLSIREVPFVFKDRLAGESKLSFGVIQEAIIQTFVLLFNRVKRHRNKL
ncbi:polyprenol monophosphomannose synthase [Acetobacteraceae bacterium]|nr:polyprenol monophosphomannose synthase [Acetobacteraceae bacterium]